MEEKKLKGGVTRGREVPKRKEREKERANKGRDEGFLY